MQINRIPAVLIAFLSLASLASAQSYQVTQKAKVGGAGRWDYVYADSDGRRLYIPRMGGGQNPGRVTVFNLDTLESAGTIPDANNPHGVAVDPGSNHGFVSSNPVVMFDSKTLTPIKTIEVQGNPDGILFEPLTKHVYVLSHRAPNVTVINTADGAIVGTIDLGGAPEQATSDATGHVYIDLEDHDSIAVVDANTLKVTAHYDLAGKGGGPAGLALDAKNHILFACCHDPHTAVILSADDGHIITTLPIGSGVDSAGFNPNTMEAFSSQGDGTLTIIKENSPTDFIVEQNVQTQGGARTSSLDSKTGKIFLITAEMAPPATQQATTQPAEGGNRRRSRGQMVPDSFTILVVGK